MPSCVAGKRRVSKHLRLRNILSYIFAASKALDVASEQSPQAAGVDQKPAEHHHHVFLDALYDA